MHERVTYEVYASNQHQSTHGGYVAACIDARTSALARPGVKFWVERSGKVVARYLVTDGKLAAWMA